MSEKRQSEKHISDYINSIDQFDKGKFNLIAAPTGSGKTTLCKEKLWEIFPFPKERVLLVTSRAMIADQLTEEGFKRYYGNDYRQIQICLYPRPDIFRLHSVLQQGIHDSSRPM